MTASITFWRGCILFIGEMPDLPRHAHVAGAMVAGTDREFEIRGRGLAGWTSCRTAWIPSNAEHEIRLGGARFASLLAEPGVATFDALEGGAHSEKIRNGNGDAGGSPGIVPNPPNGARILEGVRSIDAIGPDGDWNALLLRLVPGAAFGSTDRAAEPRLARVAERLIAAPEEAPPVEELAAEIGRSASWLQHAFKARYGVPLRRYRTWLRLKATALLMKEGRSLASAAVGAGFYDQAHFTNAFREMFGIQPGLIFNRKEGIRWFVDEQPAVRRHLANAQSTAPPRSA